MSDNESGALRRIVKFRPAFDKRDPNPAKNYGIHGVDLVMFVCGAEGAVQFVLYTNWQLPHVTKEQDAAKPHTTSTHLLCHPMPADLGYHAKSPRYKDQEPLTESCEFTGGRCFYAGSGLNAERIYEVLLREGDEGVWRELEEYYQQTFNQRGNQ